MANYVISRKTKGLCQNASPSATVRTQGQNSGLELCVTESTEGEVCFPPDCKLLSALCFCALYVSSPVHIELNDSSKW